MTATNKPKIGPLSVWIVGHPQNPLIHGETTTSNCLAVFYKKKDAVRFKRAHKGTFYKVMKATITRDNYEGDLGMLRRDLLALAQERNAVKRLREESDRMLADERAAHAETKRELSEISQKNQHGNASNADPYQSLTPRAQAALALAHKEATAAKATYVGTEHLLLGMLRQEEGIAKRHFLACGMSYEKAEYAMRVGRVS